VGEETTSEIKCIGYSEKNQQWISYKRSLGEAIKDFPVFGQEVVCLIEHNDVTAFLVFMSSYNRGFARMCSSLGWGGAS